MIKTETVRARVTPELKHSAERVFSTIGLSPSQAIVLFYKQVELRNGLPFEVTIPTYRLDNATKLSSEEYDARLEPGYHSARAGRARALSSARADFRCKHRQDTSR